MDKQINWAVLGTGVIANEMASVMRKMGRCFYAVGSRNEKKAQAFAKEYGIGKVYSDFHEMFLDEAVDVIYLATPHNTHFELMMEALLHGKHLLVEKAITLNSAQLAQASALAEEKRLVLAEAMTIYHMPLYKKLRRLVEQDKLGQVRMIQVNFGSYKEYDMANRFFNMELGGGALLDIGVYAISLARMFLSSKPDAVTSKMKCSPTGSDDLSGMVLMNPDGQMAVISLSMHCKQPKRCNICGDKGYFEIFDYPRAQEAKFVNTATGETETICAGETKEALYYEVLDMERAVRAEEEDMFLPYTQDVMELMTQLRKDWGLRYPDER